MGINNVKPLVHTKSFETSGSCRKNPKTKDSNSEYLSFGFFCTILTTLTTQCEPGLIVFYEILRQTLLLDFVIDQFPKDEDQYEPPKKTTLVIYVVLRGTTGLKVNHRTQGWALEHSAAIICISAKTMQPKIRLPAFSGQTCYMRRWDLSDVKSVFDAIEDGDAVDRNEELPGKWLPWEAVTSNIEYSEKFIAESVKGFHTGTKFEYGIFLGPKSSEEVLIGAVGLVNGRGSIAEIGFWLSKYFEGHGVITNAVKELITEARNALKVSSFVIMAMENNFKSRSIPERLNFVPKGCRQITAYGISHKLIKYQLDI